MAEIENNSQRNSIRWIFKVNVEPRRSSANYVTNLNIIYLSLALQMTASENENVYDAFGLGMGTMWSLPILLQVKGLWGSILEKLLIQLCEQEAYPKIWSVKKL